MPEEIDLQRAAIARRIVRDTFNTELVPTTDVSALTSNAINQAMYAQRMSNAGASVAFGTTYRWLNVDPSDIKKCTIFGHFYGLAYAHLAIKSPFDVAGIEELLSALSSGTSDIGGLA